MTQKYIQGGKKMSETYESFLTELNQGQNLQTYAEQHNVPIVYNPDVNTLLINDVPINMNNTKLKTINGQLVADEVEYQRILAPFIDQGTSDEMLNFQPYQTPDHIKQFMQDMIDRQQQPFEYSFDDDPSVIEARKQLEQSMAEMAGKRGFLYGQEQQDIVSEKMRQLMPQFEDAAYQREQDFLNRQMQLSGIIMQWDQIQANRKMTDFELLGAKADFVNTLSSRELNIMKTLLEQRRFDMEMELEVQQQEMKEKEIKLTQAWKKMDVLGYADNEVSILLGVPVGTQATWIKKYIMEQEQKLSMLKERHQYDIKMMNMNKEIEKDLINEREKVNLASAIEMMKLEYSHKKEITKIEHDYAQAQKRISAARSRASAAASQSSKDRATQLNIDWKINSGKFKEKFVSNNYVADSMKQDAINWMFAQMKAGTMSRETYNRLKAEYRLPDYSPGPTFTMPAYYENMTQSQQVMFEPLAVLESMRGVR